MGFHTLSIGRTALITQRYALDVTGQNIANASTPGYSRQRLMPEAVRPQEFSFGALGGGVEIKRIQRIADEFLEKQVRLAKSHMEYLDAMQDGYENLEVFFNELTENDLSTTMDNFWNSVSDFSNNVEDGSTRRTLLEAANTLRDSFQDMEKKIYDYRVRQNDEIVQTVDTVNSLLSQIAQLNQDIVKIEKGGVADIHANDMRDQRTERLKQLSAIMDVTVTEQKNGSATVTQKSRMLVFLDQHFDLATRSQSSGDLLIEVPVFAADEEEVTFDDGLLKAQVDIRDTVLKSFKDDLDQLAASFIWEVNRVHSQHTGLNGFSTLTGTSSVIDPAVTLDNLAYDFVPVSGTFEIENGNFEIIVHNGTSDEETVLNIEVDLDGRPTPSGDPDTILWDGTNPTASYALVNKMQTALDTVQPGAFTVSLDLGNHLVINSLSPDYTFSFGRDTSGVVAALGLNTLFDGYDAGSIQLNSITESNPDFLAGADGFTPGDMQGARALLELRTTGVLSNNTATLEDYYEGIVGRMGVEGARINSLHETQKDVLVRFENQREDLSGVNMDEELSKMIQYQRSYQSAARFISTVDTVYETLINM